MKILAITDLFPPHVIGGYELACSDVMVRLFSLGHQVKVLTSTFEIPGVLAGNVPLQVHRQLEYLPDGHTKFPRRPWSVSLAECISERQQSQILMDSVRSFMPDLVSVWHLGRVSPIVFATCLRLNIPVVFAISDYWMDGLSGDNAPQWERYWSAEGASLVQRVRKRVLRFVAGRFFAPTRISWDCVRNAHFFSAYLQAHAQKTLPNLKRSTVIYHGVDVARFSYPTDQAASSGRLLYVGRISQEKGLDVAIRAIALLPAHLMHVELHIIGTGDRPYLDSLTRLAADQGVAARIKFLGSLSRADVMSAYHSYDVLLFTSVWPEPFSLTVIEALACGIPVIATNTGGTGEILRDGDNSLIVSANEPQQLALAIDRMISDESMRKKLRDAGRRAVTQMSDIDKTVVDIEAFYKELVDHSEPIRAPERAA